MSCQPAKPCASASGQRAATSRTLARTRPAAGSGGAAARARTLTQTPLASYSAAGALAHGSSASSASRSQQRTLQPAREARAGIRTPAAAWHCHDPTDRSPSRGGRGVHAARFPGRDARSACVSASHRSGGGCRKPSGRSAPPMQRRAARGCVCYHTRRFRPVLRVPRIAPEVQAPRSRGFKGRRGALPQQRREPRTGCSLAHMGTTNTCVA